MARDIFGNEMSVDIYGRSIKENKREPTKASQKSTVFDNQNGKCWKCKNQLKLGHTQYHHLKFVSRGGKTKTNNLVALCANCHSELHKEEKSKQADKGKKEPKQDYGILGFNPNKPQKQIKQTWINPLTGKKEKFNPIGL